MSEQADSAQSNPILSIILAGIGLMGVAAVFLPADLVPQLTSSAPTEEAKAEAPTVVEAAPVVEKAAAKEEPVFVPVEEQSQTEQVVETVKEAVTDQVEQTQETVADVATEAANTVTDAADTAVTAVTDMMNNVMPTAPVNSTEPPANTTQRPVAPQFRPQYMPYMDGRWPAPPVTTHRKTISRAHLGVTSNHRNSAKNQKPRSAGLFYALAISVLKSVSCSAYKLAYRPSSLSSC